MPGASLVAVVPDAADADAFPVRLRIAPAGAVAVEADAPETRLSA